jgi:hypothetical protein
MTSATTFLPVDGVMPAHADEYAVDGSVRGCGALVVPWDTAKRHPSTEWSAGRYVGPDPANVHAEELALACQ